eukprot:130217-Pelagomonas_calceolata.AAC.2
MASGALLEERASDEVAIPDPQTAAAWFKGMKRDRSLEAEAKGIPRTFPLSAVRPAICLAQYGMIPHAQMRYLQPVLVEA